jgi:hypothetical protein
VIRFTSGSLTPVDSAAFAVAPGFSWVMTPTRVSRPVVLMTQNDTAPPLIEQLLGADGKVQQLPAGTTVVCTLYNPYGQKTINRRACTIITLDGNPAVQMDWQAGDLPLIGWYTGEIEITVPAPNAGVLTFPTPPVRIQIVVSPEAG